MGRSIIVHVLDQTTGERLTLPDVRLHRIGVVGESRAESDKDGRFSFTDLSSGEYSLAVYHPRYAPHHERVTFTYDDPKVLELRLRPGGFLSGQVLDEEGQPPERCWFTLLRLGKRGGRSGYISDSGDHEASSDGKFCSPPLHSARYFIRMAGLVRKPAIVDRSEESRSIEKRYFDFLYPNVHDLKDAIGIDIATGEAISGLQVRIPRPAPHSIRGRLIGALPEQHTRISVMFARDIGAIDSVGGAGGSTVRPDGTFEYMALPGRYSIEVCEFSPPEPDGRTRMLRRFGKAAINVPEADLDGVEIQISSTDQT
jgi:Carboxypeptidase regulatory-like domain